MLSHLISLARPLQWIKNAFVLAALVFAGEIDNPDKVQLALIAAAVYCLLSSAMYAFNDLRDRQQDREHPRKKHRPLASGKVTALQATVFIALLAAGGLSGSWYLGTKFLVVAICFIGLNGLYSLWLKYVVLLDVMSIAISFVIRAYAGSVAIDVSASKWLLINTLLLALFLAFGKRRHELLLLEDNATNHRKSLSKYSAYLLDQCIGVTTASVVVMYMLYTFSTEVSTKLGTDKLFVTIPFVIYGIFRYLYLIHRKAQGGSPTRVLFGDKPILLTATLWLATVIIILYVL